MVELEVLLDIRLVTFVFGLLIPLILYRYSTRNFDYWKKRGIPYEEPFPFVGNFATAFKKNLKEIELERYDRHGRIYGLFEGNYPMIVIAEPEHIKNILVKDFQYFSTRRVVDTADPAINNLLSLMRGDDWKRVRTIISPTFSTGKIKRLVNVFENCSKSVIENFSKSKGTPIDIIKAYGAFAIDVIASSAFSTKIDSYENSDNDFVKHSKAAFEQNIGLRFIFVFVFPRIAKLFNVSAIKKEHKDFFTNSILEIVQERKRSKQKGNDFLQLLMDAANEELKEETIEDTCEDVGANYEYEASSQTAKYSISKHLSIDELIANCVLFFIAGYHTTATTLSNATYLLALHQDVQGKLCKEIKEVLNETDGELTYEKLQKMKYLDNVISETLRMYPPNVRLDRTADADYELGDTGIIIPKGMVVGIPDFAMHNDSQFFPEPEKFNPDRFSSEQREKLIPYSYLPFGAGPRNCLGMRFALIEMKVCLVKVFSRFYVKTCPKTMIPLEFGQISGLLAPKDITLVLEERLD